MKRKLFTLLLAIGVLTAFQANAQQRIRILADTSGLGSKRVENVKRNDSFPLVKKELYRWLSVKDGNIVVRSVKDETDTASFRKNLYGDPNSVFTLSFKPTTTDSTNFRFASKDGKFLRLGVEGEDPTTSFEIVSLSEPEKNIKEGALEDFKYDDGKRKTEGYLASVPANKVDGSKVYMDTVKFALVGADSKGELSLKYFNEFAIYGDSLPHAPWLKYQYDNKFDKGKLYQSDSFPYFQIHNADGDGLIKIRETKPESKEWHNNASNWGSLQTGKPNPNDPHVYTWFDFKLVKDSSAILLGDTIIRLDSIYDFASRMDSLLLYDEPFETKEDGSSKIDIEKKKWFGFGKENGV